MIALNVSSIFLSISLILFIYHLFAFCFPKSLYKQYQTFVYMHTTCIVYIKNTTPNRWAPSKYGIQCISTTAAVATVTRTAEHTHTHRSKAKQSIDHKGSTFLYRLHRKFSNHLLKHVQRAAYSSFTNTCYEFSS